LKVLIVKVLESSDKSGTFTDSADDACSMLVVALAINSTPDFSYFICVTTNLTSGLFDTEKGLEVKLV